MTTTHLPANRPATAEEITHAATRLRLLGDAELAKRAESALAAEAGCYHPVVVTDFATLGDEQILLVPAGTYVVPRRVFEMPRRIIGLPSAVELDEILRDSILPLPTPPYPVPQLRARPKVQRPSLLLADGEEREFANFDNGATTVLQVVPAHLSKFAHVQVEAQQRTILELSFGGGERFSDWLYDTTCGTQIDVYNVFADAFLAGREWVAEALGRSGAHGLDPVERGIEALNEGGLKAIDAVFDPLRKLGGKLDRLLGFD